MNRNIIIKENDFDAVNLKLEYAYAIADLLITDNFNTKWGDDTISGGLGTLAMLIADLQVILSKSGEVSKH